MSGGRWPPNLLLSHTPWCVPAGVKRVRNKSGQASGPTANKFGTQGIYGAADGERPPAPYYADADGREAVSAFSCHPSCPVRLLDEQSGERKVGGGTYQRRPDSGARTAYGAFSGAETVSYGDTGGASRFYPTFAWTEEDCMAVEGEAVADGAEAEEWECAPGCPVAELGRQSGVSRDSAHERGLRGRHDAGVDAETARLKLGTNTMRGYSDTGTAARFFPVFSAQEDGAGMQQEGDNARADDCSPALRPATEATGEAVPSIQAESDRWQVVQGDCLEILRSMPDCSVDAVVTDPPAGISFMGRDWDNPDTFPMRDRGSLPGGSTPQQTPHQHEHGFARGMTYDKTRQGRDTFIAFMTEVFTEVRRVLKPGGHALVWALPRTSHWTGMALEEAGFEVRDRLAHLFGSGFPKSASVSKQFDKQRRDNLRPVCEWLGAAMQAADKHHTEVAAHFGVAESMVRHWIGKCGDQDAIPTWEQWQQLKALLGFGDAMDAEVWRLNGRKGQPGETWYEREVLGFRKQRANGPNSLVPLNASVAPEESITAPATDLARQWEGWGTAIKPSVEDWWLVRRPLAASTVAANVAQWSTGALNIAATRVGNERVTTHSRGATSAYPKRPGEKRAEDGGRVTPQNRPEFVDVERSGRWPPNLLISHLPGCTRVGTRRVKGASGGPFKGSRAESGYHFGGAEPNRYADPDGTEEVAAFDCQPGCPVAELDRQSGERPSGGSPTRSGKRQSAYGMGEIERTVYQDTGSAARFFPVFAGEADAADSLDLVVPWKYIPKASRRERNAGLEGMPERATHRYGAGIGRDDTPTSDPQRPAYDRNTHPTVKSINLMRWLCRLITPPVGSDGQPGVVLDPFCGSGSTGAACMLEGLRFIGVDSDSDYCAIAERRIAYWQQQAQAEPAPAPAAKKQRRPRVVAPAAADLGPLFQGVAD